MNRLHRPGFRVPLWSEALVWKGEGGRAQSSLQSWPLVTLFLQGISDSSWRSRSLRSPSPPPSRRPPRNPSRPPPDVSSPSASPSCRPSPSPPDRHTRKQFTGHKRALGGLFHVNKLAITSVNISAATHTHTHKVRPNTVVQCAGLFLSTLCRPSRVNHSFIPTHEVTSGYNSYGRGPNLWFCVIKKKEMCNCVITFRYSVT